MLSIYPELSPRLCYSAYYWLTTRAYLPSRGRVCLAGGRRIQVQAARIGSTITPVSLLSSASTEYSVTRPRLPGSLNSEDKANSNTMGEWWGWKCRAEHCRWLLSCELCGRGLVQCSVTNNHQRSLSSCHDQGRQTPSYVDMATVEQPVHLTIFCPFQLFLCCLILPIVSSELLTPMVAAIWRLLRQRVWCPWLQL